MSTPVTQPTESDLIVVLDHSGARIYHCPSDDTAPVHVEPLDPSGHNKHVHSSKGDSGSQQDPHRKQFYENLSKHLEGTGKILMIGDGHGASSEIDRFLTELKAHHHLSVENRIIGRESLDLHHMTEGQIFAAGRDFFSKV